MDVLVITVIRAKIRSDLDLRVEDRGSLSSSLSVDPFSRKSFPRSKISHLRNSQKTLQSGSGTCCFIEGMVCLQDYVGHQRDREHCVRLMSGFTLPALLMMRGYTEYRSKHFDVDRLGEMPQTVEKRPASIQ